MVPIQNKMSIPLLEYLYTIYKSFNDTKQIIHLNTTTVILILVNWTYKHLMF